MTMNVCDTLAIQVIPTCIRQKRHWEADKTQHGLVMVQKKT